jgi:hypothetical protein
LSSTFLISLARSWASVLDIVYRFQVKRIERQASAKRAGAFVFLVLLQLKIRRAF